MTPADHYHSGKDCSNLFNLNSYNHHHHHNNNFSANSTNNTNNSSNNTNNHHMGGQTPVFFAPASSFIVAGHKPSQELHEAMLNRGPLQLVDFKDVVGGGGGGGGGDGANGGGEQIRMGKRPQLRFGSMSREYDPGPGSAGSMGEDMSMDYMEGGDYIDHMEGGMGELIKKGTRRLGYDQVKALEKAFEVENRLEPERKVRLASQLGLQPRQVAVWFQNRRARWKTKQMERDYSLLKNKFEALKADRDKLLQEKDLLQAEVARLKGHAVNEGSILSKQATKGEQDSSTLASCSLVDDAAAHLEASKQAASHHHHESEHAEEEEEEEEEELEEASPKVVHEQKLLQNDSLSSTEDSDNGAIVDSTSMKAFQEEPEYYAQHWRLPPAPTQLTFKPTSIKSEEWHDHGENINSFNMPLDANWYSWS